MSYWKVVAGMQGFHDECLRKDLEPGRGWGLHGYRVPLPSETGGQGPWIEAQPPILLPYLMGLTHQGMAHEVWAEQSWKQYQLLFFLRRNRLPEVCRLVWGLNLAFVLSRMGQLA